MYKIICIQSFLYLNAISKDRFGSRSSPAVGCVGSARGCSIAVKCLVTVKLCGSVLWQAALCSENGAGCFLGNPRHDDVKTSVCLIETFVLQTKKMPRVAKGDAKPRGRMTAYAYFVQICREEHKKKHPEENVVFAEFSKKCAERWKVGHTNSSCI